MRARPEFDPVAPEDAHEGGRACLGVEAAVHLAARGVDALGRAAGVGDHDRQAARNRLGDGESERLAGTPVHEYVGAGQGGREAASVRLEPEETDARRRTALKACTLGSVSEQNENGGTACPESRERLEHDVPSLLDRQSTDPDEQRRRWGRAAEQFTSQCGVRGRRAERRSDAEGDVHHPPHSGGAQPIGLPESGHEHRVEGREERAVGPRQPLDDRFRAAVADDL
jgi:hypothetical protein